MLKKIVELSTPETSLSTSNKQLVIRRSDAEELSLPIEDLGVIVLDDTRAQLTQSVVIECMKNNVSIITTDEKHLPIGISIPFSSNSVSTQRHRQQIQITESLRKRLWKIIIQQKIIHQSLVLQEFNNDDCGLLEMSNRVKSGDTTNIEALAAQRYWKLLFGDDFKRQRMKPGENALLNYGYAIIRATVARSIVASGLQPSIGLFHKNKNNPFCLADDIMEPYRPYVDQRVKKIFLADSDEDASLNNKGVRSDLLSLLNETVIQSEKKVPIFTSIGYTVNSLCNCIISGSSQLSLPKGLPLELSDERD